jgi:hypothetical protein
MDALTGTDPYRKAAIEASPAKADAKVASLISTGGVILAVPDREAEARLETARAEAKLDLPETAEAKVHATEAVQDLKTRQYP